MQLLKDAAPWLALISHCNCSFHHVDVKQNIRRVNTVVIRCKKQRQKKKNKRKNKRNYTYPIKALITEGTSKRISYCLNEELIMCGGK